MGNYIPLPVPIRPAVFTASRAELLPALAFLAKSIVERRNTLPILSNVLIETGADCVTVTGTDLDLEAAFTIPANVEAVGMSYTVEAGTLHDLVKAADKAALVTLAHDPDRDRLAISHGRARNNVPTIPPADFPRLARRAAVDPFQMDVATLAGDLARLAPMISREESRYYLNGVEFAPDADGGALTMTATTGAIWGRVTRTLPEGADALESSILPRKAAAALVKALKGRDGALSLAMAGNRFAADLPGLSLVGKLVDGTYPDATALLERVAGAQRVAFIDLEPDLSPTHVETFRKALGGVPDVDAGENAFRLSWPTAPEFLGIVATDAREKAGRHVYGSRSTGAAEYLCDLAHRRGFDPDAFHREAQAAHEAAGGEGMPAQSVGFPTRRGIILGATFGRVTHYAIRKGERGHPRPATAEELQAAHDGATPGYSGPGAVAMLEREGVRDIADRDIPAQYVDGAFSVAMPREREEAVCSDVSVMLDGMAYPLRSNGSAIELSAEAVRRLCGPVDPSTLVAIPATRWHREGVALAPGWVLPTPPKLDKRRALTMSAAEMAEFARACAPVFVGVPDAPAATLSTAEAVAAVEAGAFDPSPAALEAAVEALEPVEAPARVAEPENALEARLAALEAIVARLTRPAGRVRSENERRAILRAWRIRSEARRRVAILDAALTSLGDRCDRAIRERDAAVAHLEAVKITERANARIAEESIAAVAAADARAGRMVRAASRHRTASRRAADDLRGAQAEARALTRRLAEQPRSSARLHAMFAAMPDAVAAAHDA